MNESRMNELLLGFIHGEYELFQLEWLTGS